MGETSPQDQSVSSDSAHDESYGKHEQDMKAGLHLCNPEINQPIVHSPYAYPDPYFNGVFAAYWLHNFYKFWVQMQPQMRAVSGRVPLPVDIPEDAPIYVNVKQYHGILRRRQSRAKMEAQNKLVKTRKPYLHESRHQHALNRVRGSGGWFLSSKKQQQSDSAATTGSENSGPNSFRFGCLDEIITSVFHKSWI